MADPVVGLQDLWVQQSAVLAVLESIQLRLGEPMRLAEGARVTAETGPGLLAALDQLGAAVNEIRGWTPAPTEVVVPPVNLEPLHEAMRVMTDTLEKLPDAVGKRLNVLISGGGGMDAAVKKILEDIRTAVQTDETPARTPFTSIVSSAGDTTLITPASGKKLAIHWLWAQADDSISGAVTGLFKRASTGVYRFSCEASQPFSHSTVLEFAVDEALVVNLDEAKTTYINVDYREI